MHATPKAAQFLFQVTCNAHKWFSCSKGKMILCTQRVTPHLMIEHGPMLLGVTCSYEK